MRGPERAVGWDKVFQIKVSKGFVALSQTLQFETIQVKNSLL